MKFQTALLAASVSLILAGCNGDDGKDGSKGEDLTANTIHLTQLGRYTNADNEFDESAAEIVSYDSATQKLFVVNAHAAAVDVLDLSDPANPEKIASIDATDNWVDAGGINSVDVANGLLAVAVEHDNKQLNGRVQFYNAADHSFRSQVSVGALPDMVTFTPDGSKVLSANEGEPSKDYSVDPEGSVSIIDVSNPDTPSVTSVGFTDFNNGSSREDELADGVRIFGNFDPTAITVTAYADNEQGELTLSSASGINANDWITLSSTEGEPLAYQVESIDSNTITLTTAFDGDSEVADSTASGLMVYLHDGESSVAQDLEPEYITVSANSSTAWVTLQENNAIAVIDINNQQVDQIIALGTKDHMIPGFELDASNKDGGINIRNWPVKGMYQPDSIASFSKHGETYIITANEGDARAYDGYTEETRFILAQRDEDIISNPDLSESEIFGVEAAAGVLKTTITNDTDGDGDLDNTLIFGARSFSIWTAEGTMVFDSGNQFEVITAQLLGDNFNNNNTKNKGDNRSDDKGPEPEALTVADIAGHTYAFIGLERVGGIMVYDISNPASPSYVQYLNNRDFDYAIKADIKKGDDPGYSAGDLGPEGFKFISADDSPNGKPLLVVASEVSGTTTVYQINLQ